MRGEEWKLLVAAMGVVAVLWAKSSGCGAAEPPRLSRRAGTLTRPEARGPETAARAATAPRRAHAAEWAVGSAPPLPLVTAVGTGTLRRVRGAAPAAGAAPGWQHAEVTLSGFRVAPAAGDMVTLVPLHGSRPREARVASARRRAAALWDVHLAPITDADLLSAAPARGRTEGEPFEVIAIYPAVPLARVIPAALLRVELLPEGMTPATALAVLDLTGDGFADLSVFRPCCDATVRRTGARCAAPCTVTWLREQGMWRLLERVRL